MKATHLLAGSNRERDGVQHEAKVIAVASAVVDELNSPLRPIVWRLLGCHFPRRLQ